MDSSILFKAQIQKIKDFHVVFRKKNKVFCQINFILGKYRLVEANFDEFVTFFSKVRLVKMNKEKWDESICNCRFCFKNYFCCDVIAVAAIENMVEFSILNINVPITHKTKRGRKSKAAKALEQNVD